SPLSSTLFPYTTLFRSVTVLLLRALANKWDYQPFFLALALFALSYAGLGISMYPYIVPQSITIWQAAAPENSLVFLLFGVAVLRSEEHTSELQSPDHLV